MLDCHRREKVRLAATNLCSIVTEGKKYDLLPPISARLSQKGRSTICCHQLCSTVTKEVRCFPRLVLDCHRKEKYDLLPPICARMLQKGRSTMCCHQFVLDCHRMAEIVIVATNLCSIVTEGKKHDLLPPICARLSQKGRSTMSCHQFLLDCQQKGRNLCSIVLEGKKYYLPPICVRLS